ncbi:MAG: PepSY domain-containing protein [Bacteroidetes bacterium]|nr:PepSY domain-containing protein [Bacteroidota bacterium]
MKFRSTVMVAMALCLPIFAQAQSKPKITKSQAEKAALAEVEGGKVLSGEYEHEAGKYIWSFDIKSGNRINEVWVDPNTARVIKVADESMANEKKEKSEDMKSAKITKEEAEKIALKAVPGGKVMEAELEHESGMHIWSLDVKSGKVIKEVWINPQSGKVVKITTESAKDEAHEKD